MLTIRFKGEEDFYKSCIRIEDKLERGASEFTNEMAELIKNDIQGSWSATRQTVGSGNPPAVDTGNLDSSIIIDEQGRSSGGQFAKSADTKLTFIRVNTADGDDPQGRGNYAQALEDPNYYNLPFMSPAVERAKGHIDDVARRTMT